MTWILGDSYRMILILFPCASEPSLCQPVYHISSHSPSCVESSQASSSRAIWLSFRAESESSWVLIALTHSRQFTLRHIINSRTSLQGECATRVRLTLLWIGFFLSSSSLVACQWLCAGNRGRSPLHPFRWDQTHTHIQVDTPSRLNHSLSSWACVYCFFSPSESLLDGCLLCLHEAATRIRPPH